MITFTQHSIQVVYYTENMQGKSLGEKSARMAEAWRKLTDEERRHYGNLASSSKQCSQEISVKEKKIIMRVAKRHQVDVR